MNSKIKQLEIELKSLSIFRNILNNPVIANLQKVLHLKNGEASLSDVVSAYSQFVASLYERNSNFTKFLLTLIFDDENFYVKEKAAGRELSPAVEDALNWELSFLQKLGQLKSDHIITGIGYDGHLPKWDTEDCNIPMEYKKRLEELPYHGYGIFAKYNAFSIKNGKIVPVKYPDTQSLDQLFGYEREREKIITNTKALIDGIGCNNMLLYGDAGTGKSSTIKAVANEFSSKGLRLVEVKKNQLYQIPDVVEELSASPLKFILFIDDLSFSTNDDNFSALKAILEGGVSTCGDNIAIYATSNRRHLVKETMGERSGDELHVNDTLQETMSLAARFGLSITFQSPDKDEYLNIVDNLAKEYGLETDLNQLHVKAEAHAIRHNGRSPRVAKQFIELLASGL